MALVIATLNYGGAQVQLCHLAKLLRRYKYEVMVCCVTRGGPLAEDLREAEVEVRVIGKRHKLDVTVLWKLIRIFKSYRPDIVHCQLFTANMWGRLAARISGIRGIIATVLSLEADRGISYVLVDRLLAHVTDRIVCNTWEIKGYLAEGEKMDPGKLTVVHNGVDTDWSGSWLAAHGILPLGSSKSALGLAPHRPVVGMVCRFDPRKGIEIFLDACELLLRQRDDVQFLLVGDADPAQPDQVACKAQVMKRLEQSPLSSSVVLPGLAADVRPLLHCMNVFVLTSHTEGLPNALMEAMAMERPIVATTVGGVPELVRHEIDGLLVPPGDPEAVANAVLRLLQQPDVAWVMARKARERMCEDFSLARMVSDTTKIYHEVLRM
ncbi:putative Glycosyltransferase, group 1 family protein [Candidatus Methylomirabilis oxygeniifera]|uniref:Putative Glycosyltransferase, group 1 family protein n=1 Tax=Methylomirabilis oxygeniifera TaxID=671143 RepID=D5MIF8_METO1|nr:putative Glycosyltransferase, group 1 family protein [Candidatus Methylomirabilis oxyfera]